MKNGKICILIADDEKEIRDILRLLLTGEGYAVCTAENGRKAGAPFLLRHAALALSHKFIVTL